MKRGRYNCYICDEDHECMADAIDCTLACLAPKIRESYLEGKELGLYLKVRQVIALENLSSQLGGMQQNGIKAIIKK